MGAHQGLIIKPALGIAGTYMDSNDALKGLGPRSTIHRSFHFEAKSDTCPKLPK